MPKKIAQKMTKSEIVFQIFGVFLVTILAAACFVPFLLMLAGSFSDGELLYLNGLRLLPQGFTLRNYAALFRRPQQLLTAFTSSVWVTGVGTAIGLFLLTMTAYVLSRKDFRFRRAISFYFYLTTLFNGGMVCTYIFYIRYYGLKDSFWAVILPGLLPIMYLLIMRGFVAEIPDTLIESARIDGAGELYIFLHIVLPLLQSALATIGLFLALTYWNDWYNPMLYIHSEWKFPMQYFLYKVTVTRPLSAILAMTCVTAAPVVLLYPFVQKYFVHGLTVGALKG